MVVSVKVIPKSSRAMVEKSGDGLKVHLTKPACDGLANKQLIELLADFFKVKKYDIRIIRGEKTRQKIVDV
ncbi:MAG: DUF167 domain-containing protein, partial [Candidatus Omnitrophica bacterium]|nr:DUF167 domain-containing protein [Candidatus Omnitrophota bacterium]